MPSSKSPAKSSAKTTLGDLERAVMEVLWELPEGADATVREVHAHLADGRGVAYTTVMTVMDRLARKDLVVQHRSGRAYRYQAKDTRAAMTADLIRGTLADLGSDERGPALVAFVEDASAEDIAALRAALAALGS